MAGRVLSIAIGSEFTKVCELSYNRIHAGGGVRVYQCFSFRNPDDTIDDGYITDPLRYGEELTRQLSAAGLSSNRVIFSIFSGKIASREIILPPVKENKIMDLITTGASEYFPIDINDYILSYIVLEKSVAEWKLKISRKINATISKIDFKSAKGAGKIIGLKRKKMEPARDKEAEAEAAVSLADNMTDIRAGVQPSGSSEIAEKKGQSQAGRNMRVCVYAVPSSLIESYFNFAKSLKLDIVSLDYAGNSNYQLIRRQANKGTNVYVQLNERDTTVSILRDNVLKLQRTFGYGINMLMDACLDQEQHEAEGRDEALRLLENEDLLTDSSSEAMLDAVQYLTDSVARIIDYYKGSHVDEQIDAVYISGTGIRIQGIEDCFASASGLSCRKMLRLNLASFNKKTADFKYPGEFITCIGAVIKPVNLLPKEVIEKRRRQKLVMATSVFSFTCLAAAAIMIYVGYLDYRSARKELESLGRMEAGLPEIDEIYEKCDQAAKELEALDRFEASLNSNNDRINDIILELEQRLPSDAWINTIQFSENGINMSVTATINDTGANIIMAKLYTELEKIAYFDSVDISNDVSIDTSSVLHTATYYISCSYLQ